MKSKEEIVSELIRQIRRQISDDGSNYACGHTDGLDRAASIVKLHMPIAMYQYASQVSVGFAEWMRKRAIKGVIDNQWFIDGELINTQQAFTQYLKTIEQ
jgi:GMP synthase PP-ATPase subunit